MRKSQRHLLKLVLTAIMAALCMVLDRFASLQTENLKIGFAFVPILLVAFLCGPIHAMAAWAIADLVGSFTIVKGAPIPGITVIYALMGLVYGLFLYRGKLNWWKVLLPSAINQLILALFGTTFFLSMAFFGIENYWTVLVSRLLQSFLLFALNLVLIPALYRPAVSLRGRMES